MGFEEPVQIPRGLSETPECPNGAHPHGAQCWPRKMAVIAAATPIAAADAKSTLTCGGSGCA